MDDDWEFWSVGDGSWFVLEGSDHDSWTPVSRDDAANGVWLTEGGQIVDGTIFKYECTDHTGDVPYGYRELALKKKKKTKILNTLKKNGRVLLSNTTTGAYYKCEVDKHQSASVCLDGDDGFGTDTFCTKKKKVKLYKNIIKKFNTAYNKFVKSSGDLFSTCVAKLGGDWHTDWWRYNHEEFFVWKPQYGDKVEKTAFIVDAAFPKKKKVKGVVQPTCFDEKSKKTAKKQKKLYNKPAKKLIKAFEKSPNYCS